jgi:predicted ATPase/DNA-binding SARP family transcriptional activator
LSTGPAGLRVDLLGPLELRGAGGAPVVPKGGKQRLLLAALVLHAPRPVAAERLAETLWGDEPPADPAAALRNQLSRLRALLAAAGADGGVLHREPAGYRLAVEAAAVDSRRLEDLSARAGEVSAPERRLALLDEALALWRGEPFGELAELPPFLAETARLRELHLALRERRIECLLALGRGAEAAAELPPLVDADPLRERPRALAMQALFQAGRRQEALAVFQDYRRRLSEELGLDPSPALRALHEEVLRRGEPEAAADGAAAGCRIPAPLTRLVGRGEEKAGLHRLLRSMRLVTLTGPGGSGKTRLAQEVAREVREEAAVEVAWVALDAVGDPRLVAEEVASALGLREHPGRAPADVLADALEARPRLLVLDNCEHLVAACAELAGRLLAACPRLVVLATSREPLAVAGETAWPLSPLPVPPPSSAAGGDGLEALAGSAAVQLFVERAAAVLPGFVLDADNAASVAGICRKLEGLPLALELAAARVRVLSPGEIDRRLESGFDLLSGGARAQPRHQTLRAAIDWSVQLLAGGEHRLLARLAVFAGGFDLAAAEAVCGEDGDGAADVLDLLSGLVDKSLVVAGRDGEATRYRLLDTVRAHAGEMLAAAGETAALRRRHAEWFAGLAETAEPLLLSPRRAETGRRLAADQENLRAALAWAVAEPGGAELAHRLAGALWWFWHYVGRFAEARRWAEAVLALKEAGVPERLRARVLYTAAMACWLLGDPAAARPLAAAGTRLARRLDEPPLLVRTISAHAFALRDMGEMAAAKALAAECVDVARGAGFPPAEMGFALWIQCTALLEAGDVGPAEEAAREAEALWRRTGDHWGLSMVLHGLGMARIGSGELAQAAAHFREAVELLRRDGEPYFIARSIEGLAIALVHHGEADAASRLFGAAEAIRETIGAPLLAFEEARYRKTVEILVPLLESQKRAAAWAEGRAMDLEAVIAYALGGDCALPAQPAPRRP